MKKLIALFFTLFLLTGITGCSSSDTSDDYVYDDYSYDTSYDDSYTDTYDDSYDDSSIDYAADVPQGYSDVYACNLDENYCQYVSAYVIGTEINSVAVGSSSTYPSESYCDSIGCAYTDSYGNQWYFDF